MRTFVFPGIVEKGAEGYGLFFPDLPGCVTAAETMDVLAAYGREVLQLHIDGMTEDGFVIPVPTPIEALPHDPDVDEVGIILVEAYEGGGPAVSQVVLPAALLGRIDQAAQARGLTRDQVLAEGAEALLKAG